MLGKRFLVPTLCCFLVLSIFCMIELGSTRRAHAQAIKYPENPVAPGQDYYYFEVASDHTWKVSTDAPKNWYMPAFNDEDWEEATEVPFEGPPYNYSFAPGTRIRASDPYAPTVFFRRNTGWHWHFADLNQISRVTLTVGADDDVSKAYFNGVELGGENTGYTGPFLTFNVTDLWKDHFNNCIALEVENPQIVGWLYCVMRVYLKPFPHP